MENQEISRVLAQRFIERAEFLNYKGKKRDNAALDFFTGAASLAQVTGQLPLAQHLATLCAILISVRGFVAVKEIANKEAA